MPYWADDLGVIKWWRCTSGQQDSAKLSYEAVCQTSAALARTVPGSSVRVAACAGNESDR